MIFIDANEANVKTPVGSNVFSQEIIKGLNNIWQANDPEINLLLSRPPSNPIFFNNLQWSVTVVKPAWFWTQWRLPLYLFQKKARVYFSPSHYGPRFKPRFTRTAITIFDLAFLHYPDYFLKKDLWQLKNWTKYSVKQADIIFTISQSSRDDIIKTYKVEPRKIVLVYPGHRFQKIKANLNKYNQLKEKYSFQDKKYFLFVGTLQPRKNITNLIQVFLKLKTNYKLILIGKKGWLFDEQIKSSLTQGIKSKRIIWLNFIDDSTLATFYQKAYFLVLPSLWEGFGLPVIEAASLGTPALVSANSSLNELVTNPYYKIQPPYSEREVYLALKRMLKLEKSQYEKLSNQVQKWSRKFSWQKSSQIIKEYLLKLYLN